MTGLVHPLVCGINGIDETMPECCPSAFSLMEERTSTVEHCSVCL